MSRWRTAGRWRSVTQTVCVTSAWTSSPQLHAPCRSCNLPQPACAPEAVLARAPVKISGASQRGFVAATELCPLASSTTRDRLKSPTCNNTVTVRQVWLLRKFMLHASAAQFRFALQSFMHRDTHCAHAHLGAPAVRDEDVGRLQITVQDLQMTAFAMPAGQQQGQARPEQVQRPSGWCTVPMLGHAMWAQRHAMLNCSCCCLPASTHLWVVHVQVKHAEGSIERQAEPPRQQEAARQRRLRLASSRAQQIRQRAVTAVL